MIIISQMVPLRDRGKYVGAMYARTAIATVLGPVRKPSSQLYRIVNRPDLRFLGAYSHVPTGVGASGSALFCLARL